MYDTTKKPMYKMICYDIIFDLQNQNSCKFCVLFDGRLIIFLLNLDHKLKFMIFDHA